MDHHLEQMIRQKNQGALWLSLFCLCLVLMALLVSFPFDNEYKIIRLLIFPCGLLAAPAAVDYLKRLRMPGFLIVGIAGLALLPSTVMAWVIYRCAVDSPVPIQENGLQLEVTAEDPERREVYRILREETPPDAVVVVDPRDRHLALGGKMQGDEVPALARRVLYTGHNFYLTDRCPGFPDRLERTARLFLEQEGSLPEPIGERPLYILVRSDQIPARLEKPPYQPLYRSGTMALFLHRTGDPAGTD